jgi:hypothetical protein
LAFEPLRPIKEPTTAFAAAQPHSQLLAKLATRLPMLPIDSGALVQAGLSLTTLLHYY